MAFKLLTYLKEKQRPRAGILVEEETILRAIRSALVEQHQVIEGAAAVGVAAILKDPERYNDEKICIVISGGNIEIDLLKESMSFTS